jgi:hypothetical protein
VTDADDRWVTGDHFGLDDESVRAPLQMLANALNLWETRHFGDLPDAALTRAR